MTRVSLLSNRRSATATDIGNGEMMYRSDPAPAYKLGKALSGISAPFVGNMNWAIEQAALDQQRNEADMEFQKWLMSKNPTIADQVIQAGKVAEAYKNMGVTLPPGSFNGVPGVPPNPNIPPSQGGAPGGPMMSLPSGGTTGAPPGMTPGMSVMPDKYESNVFGEVVPKSYVNIGVETAKEAGRQKMEAGQAVARDTAIFGMMSGIMGDIMGIYDTAEKSGLTGDIYRAGFGDMLATGKIPKGISDKFPQEGIEATASFVAKRNELMTRMQPLLSEQFGKEGSNRIMESLLALSERELAKLSDPRSAAVGKSIATLENFYRFSKAAGDYAKKVGMTTDAVLAGDDKKLQSFVKGVLNTKEGKLSPDEKAYFSELRTQYLGKDGQGLKTFEVEGKTYRIPIGKVDAFKKAKGIK